MFKVRFFQVCPAVASIVVRLRRASRPKMEQFLLDWDIPRILVTFAIVAYINFYLIFLHVVLSINYILWKVNKAPVVDVIIEDVIMVHMTRDEQAALVLHLVDYCQDEEVDDGNIDQLVDKVYDLKFCDGVVQVLQVFLDKSRFKSFGMRLEKGFIKQASCCDILLQRLQSKVKD